MVGAGGGVVEVVDVVDVDVDDGGGGGGGDGGGGGGGGGGVVAAAAVDVDESDVAACCAVGKFAMKEIPSCLASNCTGCTGSICRPAAKAAAIVATLSSHILDVRSMRALYGSQKFSRLRW